MEVSVRYTRFAWDGGTLFPVVLVSVFGSGGKKVLVYIRMYYFRVQYSCVGLRDRPRTRAHLLRVSGLIRRSSVHVHHDGMTASRV